MDFSHNSALSCHIIIFTAAISVHTYVLELATASWRGVAWVRSWPHHFSLKEKLDLIENQTTGKTLIFFFFAHFYTQLCM